MSKIQKGKIRYDKKDDSIVDVTDQWGDENEVRRKIFDDSVVDQIETEIKIEFLDLPYLHCY